MFHPLLSVRLMSTIGDMLLLGGNLSSDRLGKTHDTRRPGIRRPNMFGEKCDPSVIAEILVIRPVCSSELHKGQLLSPVKHPAGYRPRSAEILAILVSLCGRRGHAIRFTSARVELSTGANPQRLADRIGTLKRNATYNVKSN
jgi:hypothetical protein